MNYGYKNEKDLINVLNNKTQPTVCVKINISYVK